jgi:hypothetical protein
LRVESIRAVEKVVLILEGFIKIEDEQKLEKKNREQLRRAEPIRVMRWAFMISFATSQGGVKGTKIFSSIRGGGLTILAPGGAVLDDPIRQCLLETDVTSGLLRLNPFVT